MTTPRTDASIRIRQALGTDRLSQSKIVGLTGISALGVRAALNAMLRRGEIRKSYVGTMAVYRVREVA